MNILTITDLRKNLFSISEQISKNDDTIIVWKKSKKDFVMISYSRYNELTKNQWHSKKSPMKSFLALSGLWKDSFMSKMTDEELKAEIDNNKYDSISHKHLQ